MKNIYISLIRSGSPLGRMIASITKDEVTHAAISLDQNLDRMYAFGRKWQWCPFIGGFVKETYFEGYYGKFDNIHGKIIKVEVTDEQYRRAEEILRHFSENKSEYKYSIKKLLSNLADIEIIDEKSFICSEFVAYILRSSGIIEPDIPLNLISPQVLLEMLVLHEKVDIIYNGDVKKYVGLSEHSFNNYAS